ncbi:MAG: type II CAAX endopeptidase family protein [Flavihumibacter sp.]|nr:type II CAAX endopeptidase family protein [Flavihumibacter sp.]
MKPATAAFYQKPFIKKGWLRALIFLLFYFVFFLSVSVFIMLLAPDNIKNAGAGSGSFLFFSVILTAFFSILLVASFRKFIDRNSFSSLGLKFAASKKDALLGFLTGIILLLIATLIMVASKNLVWIAVDFNAIELLSGIVLMLLVAFYEELVFRGYILNNLLQSLNPQKSLLISALLFALAHFGNPGIGLIGFLNIFLAGVLLGINYVHTKNLWFAVMLHFSWNFFQGYVLGFQVSGIPLKSVLSQQTSGAAFITGGPFGLEASVISTLLYLLAIGVFYFYYNNKK